jgi:hypothetical protein
MNSTHFCHTSFTERDGWVAAPSHLGLEEELGEWPLQEKVGELPWIEEKVGFWGKVRSHHARHQYRFTDADWQQHWHTGGNWFAGNMKTLTGCATKPNAVAPPTMKQLMFAPARRAPTC